jgi:hypothetical protein
MQYAVGSLHKGKVRLECSNIENNEEKVKVLSSRYSDEMSVSKNT